MERKMIHDLEQEKIVQYDMEKKLRQTNMSITKEIEVTKAAKSEKEF